ncbi:MAG: hypothetical protein ACOVNZ_02190 [Crocinitomicaceae bacterium]
MPFDAGTVSSLSFRMVGPALTSGRVVDIAVHPNNKDKWYVAAACGGVWTTDNHGITFSPIFDNYGSYCFIFNGIAKRKLGFIIM